MPTERGGTCTPGGVGLECDNGHGYELPPAPEGQTVTIQFEMLTQVYGQMRLSA